MRLTLQPNGHPARGIEPTSYLVSLPRGESAILDQVDNRGWHLTIRQRGKAVSRGMFGTTHDIIALLEAEYYPPESRAG